MSLPDPLCRLVRDGPKINVPRNGSGERPDDPAGHRVKRHLVPDRPTPVERIDQVAHKREDPECNRKSDQHRMERMFSNTRRTCHNVPPLQPDASCLILRNEGNPLPFPIGRLYRQNPVAKRLQPLLLKPSKAMTWCRSLTRQGADMTVTGSPLPWRAKASDLRPMLAALEDAPLRDPHLIDEPKYDGIRS